MVNPIELSIGAKIAESGSKTFIFLPIIDKEIAVTLLIKTMFNTHKKITMIADDAI